MRFKQVGKYTVWVAAIVVLLPAGAIIFRASQMARLFQTAISPTSITATAEDALTKLNAYHGKRATDLLVRIAIANREFVDDRQELAVGLIAGRNDPQALVSLAMLLQPHIELARREAVSKALQKGICTNECLQLILHYEERLWCCHMSPEGVLAIISDESARSQIEKEHNDMLTVLDATLFRNQRSTVQVLHDVYGLGTPDPSPFGLYVVGNLHLRTACPALARSGRDLIDASRKDKIEGLLKDLNCDEVNR